MNKYKKGFAGLALLVGAALLIGGGLVYLGEKIANNKPDLLGSSFTPVQAGKTTLSGAGTTAVATTINLTSLLLNDGVSKITMSNFGDIGFATIEPGVSKKEENISFTGVTQNANGTAALTGVTRGLSPVYPYAASSTLAVSHAGGSTLILSNSAPFYNQFAIANNTTTIGANWTFNSSTLPKVGSDTTDNQISAATNTLATVNYVNSVATSGASNATAGVKGLVQFATTAQVSSGTTLGSTGAGLVPSGAIYGASSTARQQIPVTDVNGKLDPNFINGASNYTFTGSNTLASTTFTATTTLTANLLGAAFLPNLASFEVTSTVPFQTNSTSFVTIGTSTGNIASSSISLIANHKVFLSLSGSFAHAGQAGAKDTYFTFFIDGATTTASANGLQIITASSSVLVNAIPFSLQYMTPTLSSGTHTFSAAVKVSAGTSTVTNDGSMQFLGFELYN